jgi:hypothetical protein
MKEFKKASRLEDDDKTSAEPKSEDKK